MESQEQKKLILLTGVNGAGKSTLARRLEDSLPTGTTHIDSEKRAFNRSFWERRNETGLQLAQDILNDCLSLVAEWAAMPHDIFIIDRWYETYFFDCGFSIAHIHQVENAILQAGFDASMINLVIDNDLATMQNRLTHTKNQRPAS